MSISLVIADDHPLILDALEKLFQSEEGFRILERCTDGEQTLAAVRKLQPDVLLLDIRMPRVDGIRVLRELRKEKHPTRVVLFTAELDDKQLAEAVRLGLRGLVLKELSPRLLIQCIRQVYAGELWLEKHSVSNALESLLKDEVTKVEAAEILTRRQIEIMTYVASGMHNTEVAKRLFISEGTVKVHLHNIYEKLHLDSRLKLSRYAQQKGLA